jgi:lipoyl(octanoyl) transferase
MSLSYIDNLQVIDLGLVGYNEASTIQEEIHGRIKEQNENPHLIFCSHLPVITMGTSTTTDSLLVDEATLEVNGIEILRSARGGNITYHGPDQLMIYPLLDLKQLRRDIGWYMRTLEEVIIATLRNYGIIGERCVGNAGVWINPPKYKIASMGVRVRRWCTLHGIALNIYRDEKKGFQLIAPCGFKQVRMTSIAELLTSSDQQIELSDVKEIFVSHFKENFRLK